MSAMITVPRRELLKLLDAGADLANGINQFAARAGTALDRRGAERLGKRFFELARHFPDPYACSGCGCTEDRACDNGCWWVEMPSAGKQGLCSSCVKPGKSPSAQLAPLNRKTKTRRRK